ALTTLKIDVLAPIPSARVRTAAAVRLGVRRSMRAPKCRSRRNSFMGPSGDRSRGLLRRAYQRAGLRRPWPRPHRFAASPPVASLRRRGAVSDPGIRRPVPALAAEAGKELLSVFCSHITSSRRNGLLHRVSSDARVRLVGGPLSALV